MWPFINPSLKKCGFSFTLKQRPVDLSYYKWTESSVILLKLVEVEPMDIFFYDLKIKRTWLTWEIAAVPLLEPYNVRKPLWEFEEKQNDYGQIVKTNFTMLNKKWSFLFSNGRLLLLVNDL